MPVKFSQYDQDKLQKAKRLLIEVYEYYYGVPGMRREINRLDTIIAKLETLQNLNK